MSTAPALIVLAKAPRAGASKTRLCPPCTSAQAAELAEAALADTLSVVLATPAARRVLVLDGEQGAWLPAGLELIAQRGGGLDERLEAAFEDVGCPALLVGMDTPQLVPEMLARGLAALMLPGCDAVLGPARDGGYWAVGLARPAPGAFRGVPMSRPDTFASQLARLRRLGLRVLEQPPLRDVDHIEDAYAVAREAPGSRFAVAVAALAPA